MNRLKDLPKRFHDYLWGVDISSVSAVRRRFVLILRMAYAIARDLGEGQLTLRAMSLVYTTLLSLVPLLALSFSVLKGFGVQKQMRPTLMSMLSPLGDTGTVVADHVIGFVNNIKVGVLGALGLALLVYTVITLLQKIELSFNFVWRVKGARPMAQRFSQYLSVLLIGPVLIFSAVGVTAAFFGSSVVQNLIAIEPLGMLVGIAARLLPFLFVIAAFCVVYVLMPNTRVHLGSALVGATAAGILWQGLGWGFAYFIAGSTRYTAIYAGFAIVIFSMIWLYLSWLIVLIGASIASYHQHPALLATPRRDFPLSSRVKEKIALLIMSSIGRHYYDRRPALTLDDLIGRLGVPAPPIESVLATLQRAGIITETAHVPPTYLPARALETVTVYEFLESLRRAEELPGLRVDQLPSEDTVEKLCSRLEEGMQSTLHGISLQSLLNSSGPPTVIEPHE